MEHEGDPAPVKEKGLEALNALDEISSAIENDLISPPEVVLIPAGSVEFSPKSKTIIDKRPNYDAAQK